jgi:5-hydroxyisourate hydrolase-like protein (transthyretin family)
MEKIMEDIVPTEFQLSQNYPNPFKEKTTIKYCVPDKMKVRLEVFDSDKNRINTLINEIKEAGTYKVDFNANELVSGEYLYRLESGDYFETKKMNIIK